MRDACIASVNRARAAAGEPPLTAVEERGIEERIKRAMATGARGDTAAWRAMPADQRMLEAGKIAMREIAVEAQKKSQRIAQTILAHDRIKTIREMQVAAGVDRSGVDALERTLVAKYDLNNNAGVAALRKRIAEIDGELPTAGENYRSVLQAERDRAERQLEQIAGFQPIETRANAAFELAVSRIADIFETIRPGLWKRIQSGMWSIEPLRRELVNALHGVKVRPEFKRAADLFHEQAEQLREQFNAAGGVIGKLEDWGAAHNWSDRLAQKRGRDQFVSDMVKWSDPQRYVHDDGRLYTEAERKAFLEEAWSTIVSGGLTKDARINAFPGGSVKANRGAQHRVIHLRPEFAYDALRKYSDQNALESMLGSLRRMSRDVAVVETFGPNADLQFAHQLEAAKVEAAKIDPTKAHALEHKARYLQNLYDHLAGNEKPPVNHALSNAFGTLRNLQVASKLGGAAISSISDMATLYQTALSNGLNPMKVMLNSSLVWSGKSRRYARRMGLMLETLTAEAQRYANDNLTSRDMSSRVAGAVIRASGLNFVTEARRLGFSMTMMDAIGHLTRQSKYALVSSVKPSDFRILASKGIDQKTWDIWRAARIDNWGANHTLLTPDAIMAVKGFTFAEKRDAAAKLLGIVREEQDLAVITPGARERTQMAFGLQKGTVSGEIARSALLFRSFPWALSLRHFERAMSANNPYGRVGYAAALMIFMTMCGALSNWITDHLNGRDPRSLDALSPDPHVQRTAVKNWVAAFLRGGGGGVFGDFLFSEKSGSGNSLSETLLGPNVSSAQQALDLTVGNAVELSQGKDTHAGAEAVRFARGITPGANLWYTRAMTDRAIFNQLQEMADPGSVEESMSRQQSQQGTTWWWRPDANPWNGEGPDRGPEPQH